MLAQRQKKATVDLIVILVLAASVFVLAILLDLFETFESFSRRHESWNMDEIFVLFVTLGLTFGVYAWRRWRDISKEIEARKKLEDQLRHQAFHDPLTGLANRALFADRLDHSLARSNRREGGVAVLLMDLDNFKVINDSLGHEAGDQLLVAAAERLRACLRPEDTLARLGGDEFAVLLEDTVSVSAAKPLADRIAEAMRVPFVLRKQEVFVSCSIGITLSTGEQGDPDDLMRKADTAMYQAKKRGKAQYEVYDNSMSLIADARLVLESDLRRALERNELRVHYQPKVSLENGNVVGMEALVRWEHPRRGLLLPAEFIPIAEESDLIVPIGRWVLEEACQQMRKWQERHLSDPPLVMSVNLSARQLQPHDLAEEVAMVLQKTGLAPRSLELEIPESVLVEGTEHTIAVLQELKALGVWLAIDDFGTGYSSLSYLKRFPVDILKIDRLFIEKVGQDFNDTAILSGIITLAHTLGLKMVAEGVENAEQRALLQRVECDLGQGYYFSEPLTSKAASALLGASRPRLDSHPAWTSTGTE